MLTFFSDCAGLFSSTFSALCGVSFFRFLAALILIETGFGLFFFFNRGMKKL